ncbi:MAG: hypothetical protein H6Q00_415 [Holophagaceae bacterium]|nr:hypothetical protein [Holophagaceae bacterium]
MSSLKHLLAMACASLVTLSAKDLGSTWSWSSLYKDETCLIYIDKTVSSLEIWPYRHYFLWLEVYDKKEWSKTNPTHLRFNILISEDGKKYCMESRFSILDLNDKIVSKWISQSGACKWEIIQSGSYFYKAFSALKRIQLRETETYD